MSLDLNLVLDGEKYKIYAIGGKLAAFLQEQKRREPKELAKLLKLLEYTSQNGPPKNTEKCRHLEAELYEFKADSLRVIWFWEADCLILCTHGFVKKSQKTPPGEIERAKKIKISFEKQSGLTPDRERMN